MINALQKNPMLQDFGKYEVVFLVITSSLFQNLTGKVEAILEASHINKKELKFLYLSDNKVRSMEDCTTFAPHLFRLTKSYIITEPLSSFEDFLH